MYNVIKYIDPVNTNLNEVQARYPQMVEAIRYATSRMAIEPGADLRIVDNDGNVIWKSKLEIEQAVIIPDPNLEPITEKEKIEAEGKAMVDDVKEVFSDVIGELRANLDKAPDMPEVEKMINDHGGWKRVLEIGLWAAVAAVAVGAAVVEHGGN